MPHEFVGRLAAVAVHFKALNNDDKVVDLGAFPVRHCILIAHFHASFQCRTEFVGDSLRGLAKSNNERTRLDGRLEAFV